MRRLPSRDPWTRDLSGDVADGEQRAELALRQIATGGDTEALLRAVLNTAAECGYVLPPTARLRAFCRRIQQHLGKRKPADQAGLGIEHRGSDAAKSYPVPPPAAD